MQWGSWVADLTMRKKIDDWWHDAKGNGEREMREDIQKWEREFSLKP